MNSPVGLNNQKTKNIFDNLKNDYFLLKNN